MTFDLCPKGDEIVSSADIQEIASQPEERASAQVLRDEHIWGFQGKIRK